MSLSVKGTKSGSGSFNNEWKDASRDEAEAKLNISISYSLMLMVNCLVAFINNKITSTKTT